MVLGGLGVELGGGERVTISPLLGAEVEEEREMRDVLLRVEAADVELRTSVLEWRSGRDFYEDPIARLVLFPEFQAQLDMDDLEQPWAYVRDAIDKYWSDASFELTVNVGCASGRKIA